MLRAHIQLENQRAPGSDFCLVLLWIKTPLFAAQGSGFSISSTQKSPPQPPSHCWSYVICSGSFGKGTRVESC